MNVKKYFATLFKILLISVLCFAIYLAAHWKFTGNVIPEVIVDAAAMDKDKNILVVGTDKEGYNTDVMMLVVLKAKNKTASFISIPRDSLVTINGAGHKINYAHAVGGMDKCIETVENLTSLKIDNYVHVTVDGFKNVIDALDGVDFYVPDDLDYEDPAQDLYIHLKKGQQHLNGNKAEQLVRYRSYPTADIQRIKVQQDFLKAIYEQKMKPSLLLKAPQLISSISKMLKTNVPISDLPKYAALLQSFNESSLSTYQIPGHVDDSGNYYIIDKTALKKMINEIENARPEDKPTHSPNP